MSKYLTSVSYLNMTFNKSGGGRRCVPLLLFFLKLCSSCFWQQFQFINILFYLLIANLTINCLCSVAQLLNQCHLLCLSFTICPSYPCLTDHWCIKVWHHILLHCINSPYTTTLISLSSLPTIHFSDVCRSMFTFGLLIFIFFCHSWIFAGCYVNIANGSCQ